MLLSNEKTARETPIPRRQHDSLLVRWSVGIRELPLLAQPQTWRRSFPYQGNGIA